MKTIVHISMEWDSNGSLDPFAVLERVKSIVGPGVEISLTLKDQADKKLQAPVPEPSRRGRPRKEGNGAAQADAVASAPSPSPAVPQDVHGDEATEGESETEDLGLGSDHTLTPEEALERSLGGIRNAFNAGRKEEIYALRKKWGVTKFDEITPAQGHALYKDVAALLEKVGMHL